MIILLDLNYTLISNSPSRGRTPPRMERRLKSEQYRHWLVELVRPHHVILTTARPERWKEATLARIHDLTGWQPHEAHFAPPGWRNPPAIKEYVLFQHIFPIHGRHSQYLAVESNPRTRKMYADLAIPCLWVKQGWKSLQDERGLVSRIV
jgi:hypothetical protein